MDARIGQLNSGKFYAFVNGYSAPAFMGTLEEVESALGLRATAAAKKDRKPLRHYVVTVTPKIVTWCGAAEMGAYEYETTARSAAEAISNARRARRDEDGRMTVPATFQARRA